MDDACRSHTKYDGSYWATDSRGIPLARVCSKCKAEKLKGFRPEILTGYSQQDVDEPIEPEEGVITGARQ